MEEKIKQIISLYTKIPVEVIGSHTVIDRSAVASSILLHRMYANLAAETFVVENYFSIQTYGGLLEALSEKNTVSLPLNVEYINNGMAGSGVSSVEKTIGIDVEEISMMPQVSDFREDEFYKMNFSPAEIAYCILQPNPLASFAGLFAAKEAIVKADNKYQDRPFHSITIDHLPGGKPVYAPFILSISHTNSLAIAVAVSPGSTQPDPSLPGNFPSTSKKTNLLISFIAIAAFLLALLAVLLILFKAG